MKRFITTVTLALGILMMSLGAQGQLIADFSNTTLSSKPFGTGTRNIGALPAGMIQASLDGRTPISGLSSIFSPTIGWVSAEVTFTNGVKDTMAMSTSAYTPSGVAQDVLITTPVSIPSSTGIYLTWDAFAYHPTYPDGYQVYLSTSPNPNNPGNLIFSTVAENPYLTSHAVDISAYAGQTVYITFVNNSNDKLLLFVDDIAVQSFTQNDVRLDYVDLSKFNKTNQSVDIKGEFTNLGKPVSSVEITWDAGNGPQTATINAINVNPLGSYNFTHSIPFSASSAGQYNIDVTITKVNGQADANPSDNSITQPTYILSKDFTRNVLIEEGTGTWCKWCPRGEVAMKYMYDTYSDFVGIAVHNGDPMTVSDYDGNMNLSGYPGCNVDRVLLGQSVSQNTFESYYSSRKTEATPVDLSQSTKSINGNTLTVDVKAEFATAMSEEVRLAAVVIENNVTGTTSGYSQANAYAGGGNGAMGGYENKPNPVPAADMVYDHVGRMLLGGFDGQSGSVASPVNDGDVVSYTFSANLPSTINIGEVDVAVLAILTSTGEILNAYLADFPTSIKSHSADDIKLQVFPNPSTQDFINVSFDLDEDATLSIHDIQGKLISQKEVSNTSSTQTAKMDISTLSPGTYMMTVSASGASYIKLFVVE